MAETLDYAGMLLAGKTNADISTASKTQNFSLDLLPEKDAYERYGKDKGMSKQDFSGIYNDKIVDGWNRFNTGQFIEHEMNMLNIPQVSTPLGLSPKGLGRPFMEDAAQNQMFRTYGGMPVQINTAENIAEGKNSFYLDGNKTPLDSKTDKLLDTRDMMLVAKPDPEDPSSVAWHAMPKTAALAHEAVRSTFGQNFSMFKDWDALRGVTQTFTDIPGAMGHLMESFAQMGDAVGRWATGKGAPNSMEGDSDHPAANFFRRWENFSARIRGGAMEDSSDDINTFQIANSFGQIAEMMAVAYGTAGLGTLAEATTAGGVAALEGGAMRQAFMQAARNPQMASTLGQWAGITEASMKAAGAFKESGRQLGINDTDLAFMFPMIMAKTAAIESWGPNKLLKFWGSGGKKLLQEGIAKEVNAAATAAGMTVAQLPKATLWQSVKKGLEGFEHGLEKYRVGNAVIAGVEEAGEEGVDNPTTNMMQAFYDMAAPWLYKAKGLNTDNLKNGNGLFGNNFSDAFEGTGKNMALGAIGGAFGGILRKPVSNLNKGVNTIAQAYAENGDMATKLLLNAIEAQDREGAFSFGPAHLTPPAEGGQTLTADQDKSKSWNAYNKKRAVDVVMMMDKLYKEQGGKALFDMAAKGDAVARQVAGGLSETSSLIDQVRKPGGLIHEQLYTNMRMEVIKDQLEQMKDLTDEKSVSTKTALEAELAQKQAEATKIWDGQRSLRFNEIYNDTKAKSQSLLFNLAIPKNNLSGYDYFRTLNQKYNEQVNGGPGIKSVDERNAEIQQQFNDQRGTVDKMIDDLPGLGTDFKNGAIGKLMGEIHDLMPQRGVSETHVAKLNSYISQVMSGTATGLDEETMTQDKPQMELYGQLQTLKEKFDTNLPNAKNVRPALIPKPESPFDMVLDFDKDSKSYQYVNSIENKIAATEQALASGAKFTENDLNNFKDLKVELNVLRGISEGNKVWSGYTAQEKTFHDTPLNYTEEQQAKIDQKLDNQVQRVNEIAVKIQQQNEGYRTVQQKFLYNKTRIEVKVLTSILNLSTQKDLLAALQDIQVPSLDEHLKDTSKLSEIRKRIADVIDQVKKEDILKMIPQLAAEYHATGKDFNRNVEDYIDKDISEVYDIDRFSRFATGNYDIDSDSAQSEVQLILFNTLNDIYKFNGKEVASRLVKIFDKPGMFPSIEQESILNPTYAHATNPSNELWNTFGEAVSTVRSDGINNFSAVQDSRGAIKNMFLIRGVAGAGKTSITKVITQLVTTDKKPNVLVIAPSGALSSTYDKLMKDITSRLDFVTPEELIKHDLGNYDLIFYDEISTIMNENIPALSKKLNSVKTPVFGLGDDMQILPRDEKGKIQAYLPIFAVAPRSTMLTWRFRSGQESVWKLSNAAIDAITIGSKTNKILWPEVVHDQERTAGAEYFQTNDELVQAFREKLLTDPTAIMMVKDQKAEAEVKAKYGLIDVEMRNVKPVEINKQGTSVGGSEFDAGFIYNVEDYFDKNYSRFILTAITRVKGYVGVTANGKSNIGEDMVLSPKPEDTKAAYEDFIQRQRILSEGVKAPKSSSKDATTSNTDRQKSTVKKLKDESDKVSLIGKHYQRGKLLFQRASNYKKKGKSVPKDSDSTRGTHMHSILEATILGKTDAEITKLGELTPVQSGSTANRTSTIKNMDTVVPMFRGIASYLSQFGVLVPENKVVTEKIKAVNDKDATGGIGGTQDVLAVSSTGKVKIIDMKTRNSGSKMSDKDYAEKRAEALNKYKEILEAEGYDVDEEAIIVESLVDLSNDGYTVEKMYEPKYLPVLLNVKAPVKSEKSAAKKEFDKHFKQNTQTTTTQLQLRDETKDFVEDSGKSKSDRSVMALVENSKTSPVYGKDYSPALPSSMMASGLGEANEARTNDDIVRLLGKQKTAKAEFISNNPDLLHVVTFYPNIEESNVWSNETTRSEWFDSAKRLKKRTETVDGKQTIPVIVFSLDLNNDKVKNFFSKSIWNNKTVDEIHSEGSNIISTMWLPENSADPNRKSMNDTLAAAYDYLKTERKGKVTYAMLDGTIGVTPAILRTGFDQNGVKRNMPLKDLVTQAKERGLTISAPYMVKESAAERGKSESSGTKVNFYSDISFDGSGESVRVKLQPGKMTEEYYNTQLASSVDSLPQYDKDLSDATEKDRSAIVKGMFQNNVFWQVLLQNQAMLFKGEQIPHLTRTQRENGSYMLGLTKHVKGETFVPYSQKIREIYDFIKDNGMVTQLDMWTRLDRESEYSKDKNENVKYELAPESIGTMTAWADGLYEPRPFFRIVYDAKPKQATATTAKPVTGKKKRDSLEIPDEDVPFLVITDDRPGFVSENSARALLESTLNPEFLSGNLLFKPAVEINGKKAWGALYNGQVLIRSNDGMVHEEVARHERMHAILDHFISPEDQRRILDGAKEKFQVATDKDANEQLAIWAGKRYNGIMGEFNSLLDQFLNWVGNTLRKFGVNMFELNSLLAKAENGYYYDKEVVNTEGTTRLLEMEPDMNRQSWLSLSQTFGHANTRDYIFKKILREIIDKTASNRSLNSPNLPLKQAIDEVRNEWKSEMLDLDLERMAELATEVNREASWHVIPKNEKNDYMAYLLGQDSVFEALVQKQYPTYKLDETTMSVPSFGDYVEEVKEGEEQVDDAGRSQQMQYSSEDLNPDLTMSQKLINFLRLIPEAKSIQPGNVIPNVDKVPFLNIENAKNAMNIVAAVSNYVPDQWMYRYNGEEQIIAFLVAKMRDSAIGTGERKTLQSILSVIGGPDEILEKASPNYGSLNERINADTLTWWDYARRADTIKLNNPGLVEAVEAKQKEAQQLLNTFMSYYQGLTFKNNETTEAKEFNNVTEYKAKVRIADTENEVRRVMTTQMMNALYTNNGSFWSISKSARKRFVETYDIGFSEDGITMKGKKIISLEKKGDKIVFDWTLSDVNKIREKVTEIKQALVLYELAPSTVESFLQDDKGKKTLAQVFGTLLYSVNHAMVHNDKEFSTKRKSDIGKELKKLREENEGLKVLNDSFQKTNFTYSSFQSQTKENQKAFADEKTGQTWSRVKAFTNADGYIVEGANTDVEKLTEALRETKVIKQQRVNKNVVAAYNEDAKSITLHRAPIRNAQKLNQATTDLIDSILDNNSEITFRVAEEAQNIELLNYLSAKGAHVQVYHQGEAPFMFKGKRYPGIEMKYGYQKAKSEFSEQITDNNKRISKLEVEREENPTYNNPYPEIMAKLAANNGVNTKTLSSINEEIDDSDKLEADQTPATNLRPEHFRGILSTLAQRQADTLDKNAYRSSFSVKRTKVFAMGQTSPFDKLLGGKKDSLPSGVKAPYSSELFLADPFTIASAIAEIDKQIAGLSNKPSEKAYMINKKHGLTLLAQNSNLNMDNAVFNQTVEFVKTANNGGISYEYKGIEVTDATPSEYASATFDRAISEMSRFGHDGSMLVTLGNRGDKKKMFVARVRFKTKDAAGNLIPIDWFRGNNEMTEDAWSKVIEHADSQFGVSKMLRDQSLNRLAVAFNDNRFNMNPTEKEMWDMFDENLSKVEDKEKFLRESGLYKNFDYMDTNYRSKELSGKFSGKQIIPGNAAFGDMAIERANYLMFRQAASEKKSAEFTARIVEAEKGLFKYSHSNLEQYSKLDRIGKKAWLKSLFNEDYNRMAEYFRDNSYKPSSKVTPADYAGEFRSKKGEPIGYYEGYMYAYHIVNSSTSDILDGHPFNFTDVVNAVKRSTIAIGDKKTVNGDDPKGLRHSQNFIVLNDLKTSRFSERDTMITDGIVMTSPLAQARAFHSFGGEGGMVSRNSVIKWLGIDVNKENFMADDTKCSGMPMSADLLESSPVLMDMFMNSMSKNLRTEFQRLYAEQQVINPVGAFDKTVDLLNDHIDQNELHDEYAGFYQYNSTKKATARNIVDYGDFATSGGYDVAHPARQTFQTKNMGVVMNTAKNSTTLDTKPWTQLLSTLGVEPENGELFQAMAALDVQGMESYMKKTNKKLGEDGENFPSFIRKIGLLAADRIESDPYFAQLVRNANISIDHTNLQTKLMQYFISQVNKDATKSNVTGAYFTQMPADFLPVYNVNGVLMGLPEARVIAAKMGVAVETIANEQTLSEHAPFDMSDKVTFGTVAAPYVYREQFGLPKSIQGPAQVKTVVTNDGQLVDLSKLDVERIASLITANRQADGTVGKFYNNFIIEKFVNRARAVISGERDAFEEEKLIKRGEQVEQTKKFTLDAPYGEVPEINDTVVYPYNPETINQLAQEIKTYLDNFEDSLVLFLNRDPSNPSSAGFYKINQFMYNTGNTVFVSSKKNLIDGSDYDYDALKAYMYSFDKFGRKQAKGLRGSQNEQMDLTRDLYFDPNNKDLLQKPTDLKKYEEVSSKKSISNRQFNDVGTNLQMREVAATGATGTGIAANGMVNLSKTIEAYINKNKSGIPIHSKMKVTAQDEFGMRPIEKAVDLVQMFVDNVKLFLVGGLGISKANINMVTASQLASAGDYKDVYDVIRTPEVKWIFDQAQFSKGGVTAFQATLNAFDEAKDKSKKFRDRILQLNEEPMTEDQINAAESWAKEQIEILEADLLETGRQPGPSDLTQLKEYNTTLGAVEKHKALAKDGFYDQLEAMIYSGEALNRYGDGYKLRNGIPTQAYDRYNLEFKLEQMFNAKLSDLIEAYESGTDVAENHNWKDAFDNIPSEEKRNKAIAQEERLREYMDARGVFFNLPAMMEKIKLLDWVNNLDKDNFITGNQHVNNVRDTVGDVQKISHFNESQFHAFNNAIKKAQYALFYSEQASLQPSFYQFLEPFKMFMRTIEGQVWNDSEFDMTFKKNQDKFVVYFPKMVHWIKENGSDIIDKRFLTNQFMSNITVRQFKGQNYIRYEQSNDAGPDVIVGMRDSFTAMQDYKSDAWDQSTNIPFGLAVQQMFGMYTDLVYGESFQRGHMIQVLNDKVKEPFNKWLPSFKSRIQTDSGTFVQEGRNVSVQDIFGESLAQQIILQGGNDSPFIGRKNSDWDKADPSLVPRYTKFKMNVGDKANPQWLPQQVYQQSWNKTKGGWDYDAKRLKFLSYNPYSFAEDINQLVTSDKVMNRISEEEFSKLIKGEEASFTQPGHQVGTTVWIRGEETKVKYVSGNDVTVKRVLGTVRRGPVTDENVQIVDGEVLVGFDAAPARVQQMYIRLQNEGYDMTDADLKKLEEAYNPTDELYVDKQVIMDQIVDNFKQQKDNC